MTSLREWAPVLVAVTLPGLGTLYQVGQRDADNKAAQTKLSEIEKKVAVSSDTVTATTLRVEQLEARAKMTDDALRDLIRTMQRLDGNVIAVCSATRGAQCVR